MDRRKALRNMGLTLGYVVATPTLLSLVQSCKQEKAISWIPTFLSQDAGNNLAHLVDIILPKTDTPSATEVNVHIFIDRFAQEVMEPEQQAIFKMSMGKFLEKVLADSKKETMAELEPADLEPVLAKALKITKEEEVNNMELIASYTEAIKEGKPAELDDELSRFAFANNLRGLTIWGYKSSEYVGENVLAYLPVPGEYIGCGDLNELTQGKAWSI
ncbi:gluconate 2-dehydrogenase subunit 3 family protein [Arenibacter sp. 6A1]|uniref:gluconate 2-dehydrogenase subunit 3 family protein n=1 Tax=Arenibacter sp. 6A1 TaxID=2720391 RepID=UPI001444BBAF|nr:gluconate 2-dehydrogenase subunit 3 family protein [Arenibacter sp. 6A1]NKI26705.1 gluconate 2-dehydrogenase subunit 3 family protein [Arenibacter sp. 6A1]